MSATERRITDFILANASLLRDYSSQQLADVVKVSQSSVVKFAQRLGFRGYPDLKLSVNEAVARLAAEHEALTEAGTARGRDADAAGVETLWSAKVAAEQKTRQRNDTDTLDRIADWLAAADRLFLAGSGIDEDAACSLAGRLVLLGHRCLASGQPGELLGNLAAATKKDVLVVIAGESAEREWLPACREMRARGGRIVTITRGRRGGLAGAADGTLVVIAHAPQPHVETLVYEAVLRHLLDDLFLRTLAVLHDAAGAGVGNRRRPRRSAAAASRARL